MMFPLHCTCTRPPFPPEVMWLNKKNTNKKRTDLNLKRYCVINYKLIVKNHLIPFNLVI